MIDIDKLKTRLEQLNNLATKLEDVEKTLCDFEKESLPPFFFLNIGLCWGAFSDEEKATMINIIRRYRDSIKEQVKSEVEKCLTSPPQ